MRLGRGLFSPRLARFLLVWLLFRLMLSSGAVKLVSGDPTWRGLTALRFHYETQPLPPWTAWFLHQLPPWFQTFSCVFLFFVELVVPFLYFAPRRLRQFACGMTILLQGLIAATGNYAFFINNLTTPVITVFDTAFTSGQVCVSLARNAVTAADGLDVDSAVESDPAPKMSEIAPVSREQRRLNAEANRTPRGSFRYAPER